MEAASSSSPPQWSYDVFLSFMGKDTRHGFTAHLYEALCNSELKAFMDANNVEKGEKISSSLVTAIEKSMFSVVVLSENYASSAWCLEELVKILECKSSVEQTVLPVFYRVDPSDVRQLKGSFAEAIAEHEQKMKETERVRTWKDALTNVASLSGWDSRNKPEPMLIKEIVTHISDKVQTSRSVWSTELVINEGKGGRPKKGTASLKKFPKKVDKVFKDKILKTVIRNYEKARYSFNCVDE